MKHIHKITAKTMNMVIKRSCESASKSLIHYMMFLKHCDDKLIFHVTTGELFL